MQEIRVVSDVHMKPLHSRKRISIAHLIVIASFLACAILIAIAIVLNPQASVTEELSRYGAAEWFKSVSTVALLVASASWPWIAAFLSAFHRVRQFQTSAFSVCSIALALFSCASVMKAPAEGVGWHVLIFVISAWILYPTTLLLRRFEVGRANQ